MVRNGHQAVSLRKLVAMHLLIRQVIVVDPSSPYHGQSVDLRIKDGIFTHIGSGLAAEGAQILDTRNAWVTPGWADMAVQTGDPGLEHREDIQSACATAAAGGFTAIGALSNTQPVTDSKSSVEYMLRRSQHELVEVWPIGAVSQRNEGRDITEMMDMRAAGAVAFSDGKQSVQHGGLMMRALLYVKAFNGVILNRPHDENIAGGGQMHEGIISTSLGLKGIPALAEELMVMRDIKLAEYTQSRIHFLNISTAGAVELIKAAKARGLQVTASVPALNLLLSDEALAEFDSNVKVMPPLRSIEDIQALKEGLADGSIDCIGSNHAPLEEEAKKLEFPYAKFGALGLQTAFAAANTALGNMLSAEQWAEKLCFAPRRILGLPLPLIDVGQAANITVFDPEATIVHQSENNRSKSMNDPLFGRTLKGRILAVVNKRQSAIFEA